jgi:hypothetical protein
MLTRRELDRKIALESVKMRGAAVISLILVLGLTVTALA